MTPANKTETANTAPTAPAPMDFLLQRAIRDVSAEDEPEAATPHTRKRRGRKAQPAKRKYTRLTNEQKDKVLNKLLAGDSAKDVANEFGISLSTADNLRREYRRLCAFARIWKDGQKGAAPQPTTTAPVATTKVEPQQHVA